MCILPYNIIEIYNIILILVNIQMSFSPLSKRVHNEYLKKLGMAKLSIEEKMHRLKDLLAEEEYNKIVKKYKEAFKIIKNDKKELRKYHANLVNNKIRYSGRPFIIKTRKLDLDKYLNIEPKIISHAGIFFNRDTVNHNLPIGIKYGKEEYNKEVVSKYDWVTCKANEKRAFFTLRTNKEIEKFIKNWTNKFSYDHRYNASELFTYILAYWLL